MIVNGSVLDVEKSDQLPSKRVACLLVGLVAEADHTWRSKYRFPSQSVKV